LSLNKQIETPFGAKPYLWGSTEIDVTPGILKSTWWGSLKPACSVNGRIKPPKQQSLWQPIPHFWAKAAISGVGSKFPYGKSGALETSSIVFLSICFFHAYKSVLRS